MLKLDTFAPDDVPLMVCCHCGSRKIVSGHQIIGHRSMCDECIDKKQPLLKGSSKVKSKRVIKELKKMAQKKRKINATKLQMKPSGNESPIVKVSIEKNALSAHEDDDYADNSDDDTGCIIESDTSSSSDDDSSIMPMFNGNVSVIATKVNENLFKKCNELYKKHSLTKINAPPYGDCMPQACMVANFNLHRQLSDHEETKLSEFNWSSCNLVSNGKTSLKGTKHQKRRNYSVGFILDSSSHMNCDDSGVIAHMLGKK